MKCLICGVDTDEKYEYCKGCAQRLKICPLCRGQVDMHDEYIPGADGDHPSPVFNCRNCEVIIQFDATQLSYEECLHRFCYSPNRR